MRQRCPSGCAELRPCSCLDCGIDTFPVGTGRPGRAEWYIVSDAVWSAAGMIVAHVPEAYGQFLCIGCLEARIGRRLDADDFPDLPINDASHCDDPAYAYTFRTSRLVARMVSNPAGGKPMRDNRARLPQTWRHEQR